MVINFLFKNYTTLFTFNLNFLFIIAYLSFPQPHPPILRVISVSGQEMPLNCPAGKAILLKSAQGLSLSVPAQHSLSGTL
jgi:hypothetical protein